VSAEGRANLKLLDVARAAVVAVVADLMMLEKLERRDCESADWGSEE
jgi:hypothetical protein